MTERIVYHQLDRLNYSIISMHHGAQEQRFHSLSFDHFRGTLFVVDTCTAQLQVYSADDGRLLHRFGSRTVRRNHLGHYVAIDHNRERIFLIDSRSFSIRPFSLQSLHMLTNECRKANGITFGNSRGVTVDRDPRRRRTFICDTKEHRLLGLSSIDGSLLFKIGNHGSRASEFEYPAGVALDQVRDRIAVVDSGNHRVQVFSSIDGSFLFSFGSRGEEAGQFKAPQGVCIDNHSRIIVADTVNERLQAFTPEGHHISSYYSLCGEVWAVAFDEHRGIIAFSTLNQIHAIGANRWLAGTSFMWSVAQHHDAPEHTKQAVVTVTMIRSLCYESALSLLPNELLFELFSFL